MFCYLIVVRTCLLSLAIMPYQLQEAQTLSRQYTTLCKPTVLLAALEYAMQIDFTVKASRLMAQDSLRNLAKTRPSDIFAGNVRSRETYVNLTTGPAALTYQAILNSLAIQERYRQGDDATAYGSASDQKVAYMRNCQQLQQTCLTGHTLAGSGVLGPLALEELFGAAWANAVAPD